jgi:tRNA pseudouridine38-40 synthase
VWWVREPLDLDAMRAGAAHLTGLTDFRSFTDDDPEEKSTRVLLEEVVIADHGALILVRVSGSHFLWKMVRRIVGVLVEIGRGAMPPDAIRAMLADGSPAPARLTAPPSGLFLEKVFYEGGLETPKARRPRPTRGAR